MKATVVSQNNDTVPGFSLNINFVGGSVAMRQRKNIKSKLEVNRDDFSFDLKDRIRIQRNNISKLYFFILNFNIIRPPPYFYLHKWGSELIKRRQKSTQLKIKKLKDEKCI